MNPTALNQWAIRHGIDVHALNELRQMMGVADMNSTPPNQPPSSEAAVQAELRLNASKAGGRLWRNNRGAGYMQDGIFIRWGLANDSTAMNDVIKSHDLIGIKPVTITLAMVGTVIGQFWSREAKPAGWRYTGTPHEEAQLAWVYLIVSLGGDAKFSNDGGDV